MNTKNNADLKKSIDKGVNSKRKLHMQRKELSLKLFRTEQYKFNPVKRPPYLIEQRGYVGELVVIINAHIALYGRCPIKYKSEKFYNLYHKCGGTKRHGMLNINPALKLLKLELIGLPKFSSLSRLKAHLVKLLKTDNIIHFPIVNADENTFHNILIVEHFRWNNVLYSECSPSVFGPIDDKDLFISENSTQEICTWHDLTNQLLNSKSTAKDVKRLNTKEGCSSLVKFCISNTKIVKKSNINHKKQKS